MCYISIWFIIFIQSTSNTNTLHHHNTTNTDYLLHRMHCYPISICSIPPNRLVTTYTLIFSHLHKSSSVHIICTHYFLCFCASHILYYITDHRSLMHRQLSDWMKSDNKMPDGCCILWRHPLDFTIPSVALQYGLLHHLRHYYRFDCMMAT